MESKSVCIIYDILAAQPPNLLISYVGIRSSYMHKCFFGLEQNVKIPRLIFVETGDFG